MQKKQTSTYPTPEEAARRKRYLEALKKKKQKQLRRKRRLLIIGIIVVLGLLIALFTLIFRSAGQKKPELPAETQDIQSPTESETVSVPAVTVADGIFTPHRTDAAVTLDTELNCPCALMLDAVTGEIIAEKNADGPIFPASMTKLMTILVAYENCSSLDDTFHMTNEIIDPLYLDGLSLAGFIGGEDVTVRDLLYGAALPSGAEASMGLALYTSGSEEAFAAEMNRRAASIGMIGTHFTNCTGHHDDDHYSTLSDIALLLAYMEQDETLHEILSTYQYTTAPTAQHPEGILLTSTVFGRMVGDESEVCEIVGGKTGYTAEAGQCLVTYGVRNDTGRAFVCVTAGAENKWHPVYDSIYLYQMHSKP